MPLVSKKSQETIVDDYELLQELHEKWRNSKTLAEIDPVHAIKYEVFNLPNNSSNGIVMWNGKYCALLSSKGNNNPYDFIEMVMRDMEKGDIVILYCSKVVCVSTSFSVERIFSRLLPTYGTAPS